LAHFQLRFLSRSFCFRNPEGQFGVGYHPEMNHPFVLGGGRRFLIE
jgi:hypothetical protein